MAETSAPGCPQAREIPLDRKAILTNPAVTIAQVALQAGGVAFSKVLGQTILQIADALLSASIQYDEDETFCRSRQQKQLNSMFGIGLLTEEGSRWSQVHDSVNNSFTRKHIRNYHPRILDCIEANISQNQSAGEPLQLRLGHDTISWSVATISTVLLGARFSDEMTARFLEAFLQDSRSARQAAPQARRRSPFARLLQNLQLISSEIERLLESPVQAALRQDPQHSANLLLDIQDELRRESRCPFSEIQHRNLVKTLFMAGIQTTAYTLDWMLLFLARHPQHWRRLADAVRPSLEGRLPGLDAIDHLEDVHHVIHEVMRLRPVIPTIQKGVINPCEIAGVALTPGDTLNLSLLGIHNSAAYWEEPDSFHPQRFKSPLQAQSFTPFGLGRHTCIGQHLAFHILATTLIRLVQKFDIVGDATLSLETESTFLLKPLSPQTIRLLPCH